MVLIMVPRCDQIKVLTAVATKATIGIGTSRLVVPSRSSNSVKHDSNRAANDLLPPLKYKSRMIVIIRSLR
jgi:hypothetical protein